MNSSREHHLIFQEYQDFEQRSPLDWTRDFFMNKTTEKGCIRSGNMDQQQEYESITQVFKDEKWKAKAQLS